MLTRLALSVFFLSSSLPAAVQANAFFFNRDSVPLISGESFRGPLLNQSLSSYDRLISPFVNDPFYSQPAGVFRFGLTPYQNLIDRPLNFLQLDTNFGVSDINLVLGSKREQLLFIDHFQKVSKHMKGSLSYNSVVSPGFLLNSLARYQRISSGLYFEKGRIISSFDFKYDRLAIDENGGIKPGQSVTGLSLSEFEQLKTFLPDDRRLIRNWEVNSLSRLRIAGTADSTAALLSPGLFLDLDAGWKRYGTSYTGRVDTTFYPGFFNDSLNTSDTAGFTVFHGAPAVSVRTQRSGLHLFFSAGISILNIKSMQNGFSTSSVYSSPFVKATGALGAFQVDLDFETVLGDWFNKGDFSWASKWRYIRSSGFLSAWSGSLQQRRITPGLMALEYSANQFRWSNDFNKENYLMGSSRFDFWKGRLSASVDAVMVNRWVYMDESAVPVQSKDNVTLLKSGVQWNETRRKWNFSCSLIHASISGTSVRYPEWSYWTKVSYKTSFFKKALKSEVGFSAYGTDAFEAMGFMPITGERFLQNGFRTGGAPVIDAFFHAGIGSATLSLVVQRINDGVFGGDYFIAPGYPAPPQTFKFVLRWRLLN